MTYSFRTAQSSDAMDCVNLLFDWVDETPWMPCIQSDKQSIVADWTLAFDEAEKDWSVWVVENENRVVGFCVRRNGDKNDIVALYVDYEARNSGIGKRMVDLAKTDCSQVTVWAFENNQQARRFYRREGFIEISREIDDETNLLDVEHRWQQVSSCQMTRLHERCQVANDIVRVLSATGIFPCN